MDGFFRDMDEENRFARWLGRGPRVKPLPVIPENDTEGPTSPPQQPLEVKVKPAPEVGAGVPDIGSLISTALSGLGDAVGNAYGQAHGTGNSHAYMETALAIDAARAKAKREADALARENVFKEKTLGLQQGELDVNKSKETREAAEAGRKAKEDVDLNDPTSDISKYYQQLAAQAGLKTQGMPGSAIVKTLPQLAELRKADLDRQKEREKKGDDAAQLAIPGYAMTGEVRPSQQEAKDMRDTVAKLNDFARGIDQMSGLINKYGSTNVVGEGSGEMAALASNLKLTLKDIAHLGQISGGDIKLMDAQIPDPSKLGSWLQSKPTSLKQLKTARDRAQQFVESSLATRGYNKKGGGQPSSDDQAAIEWANANPNDPRAAAIRRIHGL